MNRHKRDHWDRQYDTWILNQITSLLLHYIGNIYDFVYYANVLNNFRFRFVNNVEHCITLPLLCDSYEKLIETYNSYDNIIVSDCNF